MAKVRKGTLLSAATATNGQPSAATDGIQLPSGAHRAALLLDSTAGSGTMTVTIRIWGYEPETGKWYPLSVGAASAEGDTANEAGWMNAGNPIVEIDTNELRHYEVIEDLGHFERIYAQVVAIGGTATAVQLEALWDWTRRHR